jgi:hypothetical protein
MQREPRRQCLCFLNDLATLRLEADRAESEYSLHCPFKFDRGRTNLVTPSEVAYHKQGVLYCENAAAQAKVKSTY